jgi:hypothetical protein
MSHENQSISLMGTFDGPNKKDLLSFKDVDLNQITPLNNKLIPKETLMARSILSKTMQFSLQLL